MSRRELAQVQRRRHILSTYRLKVGESITVMVQVIYFKNKWGQTQRGVAIHGFYPDLPYPPYHNNEWWFFPSHIQLADYFFDHWARNRPEACKWVDRYVTPMKRGY